MLAYRGPTPRSCTRPNGCSTSLRGKPYEISLNTLEPTVNSKLGWWLGKVITSFILFSFVDAPRQQHHERWGGPGKCNLLFSDKWFAGAFQVAIGIASYISVTKSIPLQIS